MTSEWEPPAFKMYQVIFRPGSPLDIKCEPFLQSENSTDIHPTIFLDPCDTTGTKECVVTGSDRLCVCNVGYWGDKCEKSGCSPDPCQNNANCEPVLAITADTNNFVCTCQDTDYFIGEICDESSELKIELLNCLIDTLNY